jgi:hypothetical protein
MVTAEELDRAVAMGRAELTRTNKKPIRCVRCSTLCDIDGARRLIIDGQVRGFLCPPCQWERP